MSDFTWIQLVADKVLKIANERRTLEFELREIYEFDACFRSQFPKNQNIQPKIRQSLQRLRDLGFIQFLSKGRYVIDADSTDIYIGFNNETSNQSVIPETSHVLRMIRLRNTILSADIKRRYDNVCQVCGNTVELAVGRYSEAHHLKPIGDPHVGSDTEDNIVVLCPNHHAMIDRGAIDIDPSTLLVRHVRDVFESRLLIVQPWHKLNQEYLDYNRRVILKNLKG